LDVARTSNDSKIGDTKGIQRELVSPTHLYSLAGNPQTGGDAQEI